MKKSGFIILIVTAFIFKGGIAQIIDHPTIDKLKVGYMSSGETVSVTNGKPNIKVFADAEIRLKSLSNLSKIYFKILNKATNAVLYQVSYSINSNPVIQQGRKIFTKDGLVIHIGDPQSILLDTYLYQVTTEDNSGTQTIAFSIIQ
ncbi:MAG: hypothetical protein ACXVPQ_11150 [Bacteroidia bacterium]